MGPECFIKVCYYADGRFLFLVRRKEGYSITIQLANLTRLVQQLVSIICNILRFINKEKKKYNILYFILQKA